MKPPLDILHVIPAEPFGGAQGLVLNLAAHQLCQGLAARILFTVAGSEAKERARELGIPSLSPANGTSRLQRIFFVTRTLREAKSSILHLHMPSPWIGTSLPPASSAPAVVHLHTPPPQGTLLQWGNGAVLRRSRSAIAVSQWIAEVWRAAYPRDLPKCDVIYNAVAPYDARPDMSDARSHRRGAPVFGVATRLTEDKGVGGFLAVAAAIKERRPDACFRVAGSGPFEAALRRESERLGVHNSVVFEGFQPNVEAFWRGIDVSIFTAQAEPFGLRILEPIMAGAPVVAYRTGAGSDEILDRCRGVVPVENGDVLGAAAVALKLADDRRYRQRIVAEGCLDIERWFRFGRMASKVDVVYEHLAKAAYAA
jgi:glycosyltransferase involved in cell wall biosynthesis